MYNKCTLNKIIPKTNLHAHRSPITYQSSSHIILCPKQNSIRMPFLRLVRNGISKCSMLKIAHNPSTNLNSPGCHEQNPPPFW